MNINDQDLEVSKLLKENNILTSVIRTGFCNDPDWKADQWQFKIGDQSFDYKTGLGHRIKAKNYRKLKSSDLAEIIKLKELYDNSRQKAIYQIGDSLEYAVIPTQASVLYCLIMDAQANNESFNFWCDNYGYDNDSMKAFKIYQECCDSGEKLSSVLNHNLINQLTIILEDY